MILDAKFREWENLYSSVNNDALGGLSLIKITLKGYT